MKPNISNHFIRLLRTQERKTLWTRMVSALAVVVVIGVAYALMLPAITMENQLVCGLPEHVHTEECYAVVDGEQALVCGLSEHVHNEMCLAAAQAKEPEPDTTYTHQHGYSCYVNGVLVCTLQETDPAPFVMDPAAADPEAQGPSVTEPGQPAQAVTPEKTEEPEKAAEPGKEDPEKAEDPDQLEVLNAEPTRDAVPAEYLNIRDQENAKISFTLKVGDKEVRPNHFFGEGTYDLSITNVELPSYDGEIFYVRLDVNGFSLFAGKGESVKRLEDYSREAPGSAETVYFWADRDADGYYIIYIQPKPGAGIVYEVAMSGSAISNRSQGDIEANKSSEWSPRDFAYRYNIVTKIPAYGNFPDQAFSIRDWTTIGSVGYSPFAPESRGENLAMTYQIGTQTEYALLPIDQVCNNPQFHLAYYQSGDQIYLLNRTTHDGECLTTAPVTYAGWCSCWEQEEDTVIRISYVDTYAQQFFASNPETVISDRVTVKDQNSKEVSSEARNAIPKILDKGFDPINRNCRITINESLQDLSEFSSFSITDRMTNAYYDGNLSVVRESADKVPITLVEGVDYTLQVADNKESFTIALTNPGAYMYTVIYGVQKIEGVEELATNNVEINNTRINKDISMNFNYEVSSSSYSCDISFIKRYEDGNPVAGAEFGLFDANGTLLARSYTTEDGKRMIIKEASSGGPTGNPWGETSYSLSADEDRVIFDDRAGLRSGQLFYIQEIEAPKDFLIDTTKYYFFITSHPSAKEIAEPITTVDGRPVMVLDNWALKLNPALGNIYMYYLSYDFDVLFENYKFYILPETGGPGVIPVMLLGGFLLVISCVYLLRRRRERRHPTT